MRNVIVFAAGFLGVGFAWVSYVTLFVEPGMGFEGPADFFDAQKVAAGYAAAVWFVSNVFYLMFPVAVMAIAYTEGDRLLQSFGISSAVLWLVVGAVDRVGIQLPALLSTNEAVVAAIAVTLPIRFGILKAAVVALGFFAWRTTRVKTGDGAGARVWRGFGWVVLVASLGFLFAFLPVPVVFAVWGIALAVRDLRARRGSALRVCKATPP
jgi:hypothetical protein